MELDFIQKRDKKTIEELTKKYVTIISEEYKEEINPVIKDKLLNATDYDEFVQIRDIGTISLITTKKGMFFPIEAYKVLDAVSHIPGFGNNPLHKTYSDDNRIINDNTYETFIRHCFIKGVTPLEYFKEILLHECMHLCGGNGGDALLEGINELKSRELAEKYDLELSCCGYPKEVKIAYELQEILGKELMNEIEFKEKEDIYDLILRKQGKENANLFQMVKTSMNKVYESYYRSNFSGIYGPFKKAKEYRKIDYSNAYEIINNYKQNIIKKKK